jgi:hypothetical protein
MDAIGRAVTFNFHKSNICISFFVGLISISFFFPSCFVSITLPMPFRNSWGPGKGGGLC